MSEAERIEREVLCASRRVLGEEHPDTLTSAGNLASSLSRQGKYAEAERIEREVLCASRRVLGEEHPDTLRGCEHSGDLALAPRGSTLKRSGSSGRCFALAGGYWARSIPTR
jgi:hypothetical protein